MRRSSGEVSAVHPPALRRGTVAGSRGRGHGFFAEGPAETARSYRRARRGAGRQRPDEGDAVRPGAPSGRDGHLHPRRHRKAGGPHHRQSGTPDGVSPPVRPRGHPRGGGFRPLHGLRGHRQLRAACGQRPARFPFFTRQFPDHPFRRTAVAHGFRRLRQLVARDPEPGRRRYRKTHVFTYFARFDPAGLSFFLLSLSA